jgi:hypothetical protein
MHANGTSLGDPIEVGAVVPAYQLTQAGGDADGRQPFVFSTIKGYAGHSEAAAGAVGVLEVVSVLMHQALAPALHVRQLNPYIAAPLQGSSAVINRSTGLAPVPLWQQGTVQSPAAAGARVAMGVSSFGAQGTNAHAILGHSHTWALQQADIVSPAGSSHCSTSGSPQQQLVWQGQCFWVAPVYQRLISRALISRPERSKRSGGLKVAFEVRLDAPGLARLWSYLSTPATAGQAAQPYLCNSLLLAAAASAGSLMASSNSTDSKQMLVLQNVVLAPPQVLPSHPGQPGAQLPVLLVACNISTGSCVIDIGGRRQLQCSLGVTAAAVEAAESPSGSEQQPAGPSMSSRLQALLGLTVQAPTAAAVAPGLLLGAQHRQQHTHVLTTLSEDGSSSAADGFVLHPAGLEASLQSCMVSAGQANALWLSSLQALTVPVGGAGETGFDGSSWLAAETAHAADGSTCQVDRLSLTSGTGSSSFSVFGALLAADATTATEAAAAVAEAAAGVTSEEAAAAALSAVTAATNPLMQLDET